MDDTREYGHGITVGGGRFLLGGHRPALSFSAEAMEPRAQLAFSREQVPADFVANVGLLRLLLQRADAMVRQALDVDIADTGEWFESYSDHRLAGAKCFTSGSGVCLAGSVERVRS